jgi:DnaA family protein
LRQRAFEFSLPAEPTLELFITGANRELVERLSGLGRAEAERCIYIWGAPGSGRTHLLKAAVALLGNRGANARYVAGGGGVSDELAESDAIAVDDVERLDDTAQIALFNLFNALRERGGTLLAAGNAPPAQLKLRADLVTRLGWGLVYQVHALTDEEKAEALAQHASARGFRLEPEVRHYLLNRVQRDMPTLLAMLDQLDRYSLEEKRPITVPLLRELLDHGR